MSAIGAPSAEFGWSASIAEWLAGLFVAPLSADAIARYRGRIGTALFEALAEEPQCAAGVQQIQSALITEDSPVVVARQLSVAFTRLFDGLGGVRTVSLYESGHVGRTGRLFQAPAGDMERLLRNFDVSTGLTFHEPPDHLSIELAMLARLVRDDADHQAQAALLDDHLLVWVPGFAEQCRDRDRTGFYAGAAQVLRGFLFVQRAILPVNRTAER